MRSRMRILSLLLRPCPRIVTRPRRFFPKLGESRRGASAERDSPLHPALLEKPVDLLSVGGDERRPVGAVDDPPGTHPVRPGGVEEVGELVVARANDDDFAVGPLPLDG